MQRWVSDTLAERFIEVDAARLLILLAIFAEPVDDRARALRCFPRHDVAWHFTPEYRLQKLDFLLRYPTYFAYELTELCRTDQIPSEQHAEAKEIIRTVFAEREPDLQTDLFRKFWRGAYQRLDDVESWWHARALVFTGTVRVSDMRSQKHYFVTHRGAAVAEKLAHQVEHAAWWQRRVRLIHRFFGALSAAQLKELQYSHPSYRQAQLDEVIPDLLPDDVEKNFADVFSEPMEVARA